MAHAWYRRVGQQFGIDAPRMAVRTHLPLGWRVAIGAAIVGIVAGMWWWGFDFGQIFGGFNRKEVETRIAELEADVVRLGRDADEWRSRATRAESDLAMTQATLATLSKQAGEHQSEATQLKEEIAFLRSLVSDSGRGPGVSIERVSVEPEGADRWHYRLLIVRGGTPREEFQGHVALSVALGDGAKPLVLPDDAPDQAAALRLRFKYYQRVEGSFRVPAGATPRTLTVRAFEAGSSTPRATRDAAIS